MGFCRACSPLSGSGLGYGSPDAGQFLENEDAVQEIFLRAFNALHKFDLNTHSTVDSADCNELLHRSAARRKSRKVRLWSELTEFDQERLLRDFLRKGIGIPGLRRQKKDTPKSPGPSWMA